MSKYEITINGTLYVVEVGDVTASPVRVVVNGEPRTADVRESSGSAAAPVPPSAPVAAPRPEPEPVVAAPVAPPTGAQTMRAPMPGKILSIRVKVGDRVNEGDTICTLEAMKMEMPISSTASGEVKAISVEVGDTVAYDAALVSVG